MKEPGKPVQSPTGQHSALEYVSSGLLALLLAAVVWVMAVYQDPPVVNPFYNLPIKYVNMPENLVPMGKLEERASVSLRAPKSHWSELTADSLEVVADLSGLDAGIHSVDVSVRTVDRMAMISEYSPKRVVIRLEEKVLREMAVQPELEDPESVPPGYTKQEPQVSPQKVMISGPRSAVEAVTQVVARGQLNASKTTVETQVPLEALDANGRPVNGAEFIEFTPATVNLKLGVEPLANFRDVIVSAPTEGRLASGYWVSGITIEPPVVTLQGEAEVIQTMPAVVSTEPIDIDGLTESISRRVALDLPEGVSVYNAGASGPTVLVRIEITPNSGGRTLQPKIEMQGLRSGLSAVVEPDTIDVILSGPMPELQDLQPGDVRVMISLFGLGAGRHSLKPTVVLPEGSNLKVENTAPDTVEVVIRAQTGGAP